MSALLPARLLEALERLAARGDAELPEQALHVRAHGVLGDEEPRGDLVRAEMTVEEEQHFELARAQHLRDRLGHDGAARTAVSYLVEKPPGHSAGESGLTLRHAAQERHDPLRGLALQEVAGRTAADRTEQIVLVLRGRHDDHLRLGRRLTDTRKRRQTVPLAHR